MIVAIWAVEIWGDEKGGVMISGGSNLIDENIGSILSRWEG